jgi:hypothetical protein
MKKYYTLIVCGFLTFLSCTSNNDDFEDINVDIDSQEVISKEGFPVQVWTRSECSANDMTERKDVTVNFYTTQNLFDFTNKTLLATLEDEVKFLDLANGSYYFEALDLDKNMVVEGIFRMPEDLYLGTTIILSKGRKRGIIKHENPNGAPIITADVIHTNEITSEEFRAVSNENGRVCVELNPGRYNIKVTHPDYLTYDSTPGFNVFWTAYDGTNNFFLDKDE